MNPNPSGQPGRQSEGKHDVLLFLHRNAVHGKSTSRLPKLREFKTRHRKANPWIIVRETASKNSRLPFGDTPKNPNRVPDPLRAAGSGDVPAPEGPRTPENFAFPRKARSPPLPQLSAFGKTGIKRTEGWTLLRFSYHFRLSAAPRFWKRLNFPIPNNFVAAAVGESFANPRFPQLRGSLPKPPPPGPVKGM